MDSFLGILWIRSLTGRTGRRALHCDGPACGQFRLRGFAADMEALTLFGIAGALKCISLRLLRIRVPEADAQWFARALSCEGVEARNLGSDENDNVRAFWTGASCFAPQGLGPQVGRRAGACEGRQIGACWGSGGPHAPRSTSTP